MQILKAKRGKSRVVSTLIDQYDCFTVLYKNETFIPYVWGANVYTTGIRYSLSEVKDFIVKQLGMMRKHIHFLIVYTNLPESEITDFANELAEELEGSRVTDVLVTCKPD